MADMKNFRLTAKPKDSGVQYEMKYADTEDEARSIAQKWFDDRSDQSDPMFVRWVKVEKRDGDTFTNGSYKARWSNFTIWENTNVDPFEGL